MVSQRDGRAFDQLYLRHVPALYGLALRLTGGDQPGAEDAVHDALLRAVERLATFRWESSLRTWLSGFVIHRVHELYRRSAREVPPPDEWGAGDEEPPVRHHDLIDLRQAIANLPNGYREVLVLHDIEGYRHDEIAALLGIVPGASKSQLSRARSALRRALGAAEGA